MDPPFAKDDHALLASALVFKQVDEGFGKVSSEVRDSAIIEIQEVRSMPLGTILKMVENLRVISKHGYAAAFLYVASLYASKASVVFLFMRISPHRLQKRLAWGVQATLGICAVISIFPVALKCDLSRPWITYSERCPTLPARCITVATFDILTEVILLDNDTNGSKNSTAEISLKPWTR